jgi:hypothetical protein
MSAGPTFSAFQGDRLIAAGSRRAVTAKVRAARGDATVLVFDDATGAQVDLDPRVVDEPHAEAPRGRGRPKLGVVAREVTLLPRHWEWLAHQPRGASGALRKLVEDASRNPEQRTRAAANAAYNFLHAIAGDRPGYEEALRALFANDRVKLEARIASWPADIRAHALRLAYPE